jgi:UDP-N-acetyl-D-mannosaminuronic acid dehydrogenase
MPQTSQTSNSPQFDNTREVDICIVGGAGHVGLPLGIVFANNGLTVRIFDLNEQSLETIAAGQMPFDEHGAEPLLKKVLDQGKLFFTSKPEGMSTAKAVIVTIGTPVDEFLNPDARVIQKWADQARPYLSQDQLLILRSTVYPGTTDWLEKHLRKMGMPMKVAYCPERIVQGFAVKELQELPQLVSGVTPEAEDAAAAIFQRIAPKVVRLSTMESEFAKLFANAYRYIHFAIANQFYMIADSAGVDYNRVLSGLKQNYPRANGIPGAGLTAGPCLFKDTMQLAAFSRNQFPLGHAAMLVNEGLVLYMVDQIAQEYPLEETTVGLLGMAFKADCDDTRSSLSYKLKKTLAIKARAVLTTDPQVTTDPALLPVEQVIEQSDLLILCTPHSAYRDLDIAGKPIVDLWDFINSSK